MKAFEQIVALVGHLAWPTIAIILMVLLRKELKSVFSSLAKRVSDPTSELSIGDWLTIKNTVTANAGKLESLELGLQVVSGSSATAAAPETAEPLDDDKATLYRMAQEYLTVKEPDYAARVRRKNQLAAQMGNLIIQRGISRGWVSAQQNEGLIVGLASAVNAVPKEGDLDLLLRASTEIKKLHVMYRIVVAMGRLFESRLATAADIERTNAVLNAFKEYGDASLKRRIDQTESIINLAVGYPPEGVNSFV
jgi:hypothetical protein